LSAHINFISYLRKNRICNDLKEQLVNTALGKNQHLLLTATLDMSTHSPWDMSTHSPWDMSTHSPWDFRVLLWYSNVNGGAKVLSSGGNFVVLENVNATVQIFSCWTQIFLAWSLSTYSL